MLTIPFYSFLIFPTYPASHLVYSSPAALSLPLLAQGLGGSRNPKRMRPRAAATSSQPAGQRLRGLRGRAGGGRCGEAGSAREQRGRDPMRSADGGGGGAVRAEGRSQEAVAGEPGRPRRQSLPGCRIPEGISSVPHWPPTPPIAPQARVRSRSCQPFATRLADCASCIMCGKGPRAGGVLRGGAGVRCGRR